MDDPLCRSNVWLRNAFSIQRGERNKKRTGTEERCGSSGGKSQSYMKESPENQSKGSIGNMSQNNDFYLC